jgi:hypothetical protein
MRLGPTMAERTTQVVHVGCACDLCAPLDAYVVAHEYVLRAGGTAIYRRSYRLGGRR